MEKSPKGTPRKRRTVTKKAPTGNRASPPKKKTKDTEEPDTTAETVDKASAVADKLVESVKESLEYELINRDVRVTVRDKRLTFTTWGLVKEMQFGGRIVSLVNRLKGVLGPEMLTEDNLDIAMISQLFSVVAEDILDIVAGSISDPFKGHGEAYTWIDQNCDFEDLFNMAAILYDQNLKGEDGLENGWRA